jgi:hypothetical protein
VVSNHGPLPCEGSALPLSYTPQQRHTVHGAHDPLGADATRSEVGRLNLDQVGMVRSSSQDLATERPLNVCTCSRFSREDAVRDLQTHSVVSDLEFALVVAMADPVRVSAHLRYDVDDPYAVCVSFEAGSSEHIDWTFARELLESGLSQASGEGDVKVWSHGAFACLALCSPSGRAVLETAASAIRDFLAQTYELVPAGTETDFVDVDRELSQLLA